MVLSRSIIVLLIALMIALPTQLTLPVDPGDVEGISRAKISFLKSGIRHRRRKQITSRDRNSITALKIQSQKFLVFAVTSVPQIQGNWTSKNSILFRWSFFYKTINATRQLLWHITKNFQKSGGKNLSLNIQDYTLQKIEDLRNSQDPLNRTVY